MRLFHFIFASFLMIAPMAQAQEDSVFQSYEDYAAFVDKHIMTRDFETVILRLGGRDEYTPEQLKNSGAQLRNIWPADFTNKSVFRHEDLGGGLSQEGRVYWRGKGYAYFYALMHRRDDGFVVLSFHLNTNSKAVMERF